MRNIVMVYQFLIFLSNVFVAVFGIQYDVVIVGAGLSGLGAGKYFTDQNVNNFIMLEAQDYIGGRMKSSSFANETISLGAGWIHGAYPSNSMLRLANKYNMKRFNDSYGYGKVIYRYLNNGSRVPENDANLRIEQLLKFHEAAVKLAKEKRERDGIDIDMATSLRWAGFTPKDSLDHALIFNYYQFENGLLPLAVSTIPCGMSGKSGIDQVVIDKRGYFYPVHEETKSFHNKIKRNTEVKKIERLSNGSFIVTTANGATYLSKFVLVTVSSGVLIANAITFSPPLPSWKVEAINMVPMVHYCKIFLRFSNTFWDTDKAYIIFATKLEQKYVHWQNFDIDGLFKGKSVLLATLVDDACQQSFLFDDEKIKMQVYEALKKVYPNATMPIEILRNNFSINPFVRGAYSNQVPGITENHYLSLEHPVHQRLYFAGEHHGRWIYGFAHKAYEIGMEVARNMTACLKYNQCSADKPNFSKNVQDLNASVDTDIYWISIIGIFLLAFFVFVVVHSIRVISIYM